MNSYDFGLRSRKNLETADPDLIKVAEKALSYGVMDFSVIEGHRSLARQLDLYKEGRSEIDGINRKGKHNYVPSLAIDILPYPAVINGVNVWNDKHRWCQLSGLMFAAASELGLNIRWGGDWDSDGNNNDSNFNDYPHYEKA